MGSSHDIGLTESKAPWLRISKISAAFANVCGSLLYTLTFHIASIAPVSGNAATTPLQDTGDPALADAGVDAILNPPFGGTWGSNS